MLIATESPKALAERTLATLQRLQGSQGESVAPSAAGRGNKIDVRPNWKEQPPSEGLTGRCGDEANHFWGCDLRHHLFNSVRDDCAFLMGDAVNAPLARRYHLPVPACGVASTQHIILKRANCYLSQ